MSKVTVSLLVVLLLAACGGETTSPDAEVAAPLGAGPTALAIAEETSIEAQEPRDWDDLHNVFRLSDAIVSGSEPHGEEALKRIAEMGVKTILSVDGKTPDHETAARLGMRYVHVPIQYSGITEDERVRIAKAFRELEGPFFVHCFHGKHRGPAAAALGRLVVDGVSRERAIAEMRHWCGTSKKYGGLYETIARGAVPTAEETRAFTWDFPAAYASEGFRQVMIGMSRAWDHLLAMRKRGFETDPEHPDLNARNEARILEGLFASSLELPGAKERPEDHRTWLAESREHAATLVALLAEPPESGLDAIHAAMDAVKQRCDACHAVYRNQ